MQKIKCPQCNSDISSTDTKCINCGLDMSSINYMHKQKELIKEGKIKDESKNKKTFIIIIELLLFLVIGIVYIKLFIPKILEVTEESSIIRKENRCIEDEGTWNDKTNSCTYEY